MVFSMSSKFIGNITTNLLVPAPELIRLPLVNHETLSTNVDVYELATAATTDTMWLPAAWLRLKPIYILNGSANGSQATIVCCTGDSLSGISGNHAHFASRAHTTTFMSNAAHAWFVNP
jgi:hypothetical protein